MGKIIADSSGYTGNSWVLGDSDLYGSKSQLMGVLAFTQSINEILKTSATSWSQLNFTEVTLALRVYEITQKDGYTIGISHQKLGENETGNALTTSNTAGVKNFSFSSVSKGDLLTFSLTELFNNLTLTSTNFTPATSTWYIYVKNSNLSAQTKMFRRNSNSDNANYIEISGGLSSPFHIYENNNWVTLTPYIYDDKWIRLDAQMF